MNLSIYLKNKYRIITALFLVWVFFLSDHDLFFVYKNYQLYQNLLRQKESIKQKITEQEHILHLMNTDIIYLEKYAREKYFFKKSNEVIFLDSLYP